MNHRAVLIPAALALAVMVSGCGKHDHGDDGHAHKGSTKAFHHKHEAPRGGTLIEIGDHVAHIELLHDAETGKLTVYGLSAHADNPMVISMPELPILLDVDGNSFTVSLQPVANALTGETVDSTSEFSVTDARLSGVSRFTVSIPAIQMQGQNLGALQFRFPEGAEE